MYAIPHLLASYFVSNHLYGKLRHPFYSELFEFIQSIYLVPAVLSVFRNPRAPRFRVTPKAISLERDTLTHLATPFYLMFLLNLLAFCAGAILWLNQPTLLDTITICLCWNTFNMFLVICCLGVVWERRQLRCYHRYTTHEEVVLAFPEAGTTLSASLQNLSTAGVGLQVARGARLPSANALLRAVDSFGRPYELPIQVLRTRLEHGSRILGCRFMTSSEELWRRVIGFVYGDSARWKYFADGRRVQGIGTIRAFFKLVRIGLQGTWRHAAGLMRLGLSRILRQAKSMRQRA
jgi:cellulose synthase (UDP-forming)